MASGSGVGSVFTWRDSSGKRYTVNPASSGGYMQNYETYAKDRKAQFDTNTEALQQTLESNNETTNANYDNSARQAYVDYMRKQRALPSQLQALGVRGGATESGLLNLYNNYGVEHAANEQQRNADLTSNRNAYNDAYNLAYQTYLDDLNTQKQQALANQINEYNNEVTRFSSTVAQYPTTESGYDAYQSWITSLEKSKDPLKDIKIAIVRQQMAAQFPNGKPVVVSSSSGGGGGYSRGYSSSGGGGGNNNSGGFVSGGATVRESQAGRQAAINSSLNASANKGGSGGSSRRSYPSIPYYGGGYRANRR